MINILFTYLYESTQQHSQSVELLEVVPSVKCCNSLLTIAHLVSTSISEKVKYSFYQNSKTTGCCQVLLRQCIL